MQMTKATTEALRTQLQKHFPSIRGRRFAGRKMLGQLDTLISQFQVENPLAGPAGDISAPTDLHQLNMVLWIVRWLGTLKGKGKDAAEFSVQGYFLSIEVDCRVDILAWFFGVERSKFLLETCALNTKLKRYMSSVQIKETEDHLDSVIRTVQLFLEGLVGELPETDFFTVDNRPVDIDHRLAVLNWIQLSGELYEVSATRWVRFQKALVGDSPGVLRESDICSFIETVLAVTRVEGVGVKFVDMDLKLEALALTKNRLLFSVLKHLANSLLLDEGVFNELLSRRFLRKQLKLIGTLAAWTTYAAYDLTRDNWLKGRVEAQYSALSDKPEGLKTTSQKAAFLLRSLIPSDFVSNGPFLMRVQLARGEYRQLFEKVCPGKPFSVCTTTPYSKQGVPDSIWLQLILEGASRQDFANTVSLILSFDPKAWRPGYEMSKRWSTGVWHQAITMPPLAARALLEECQIKYTYTDGWKTVPPFRAPMPRQRELFQRLVPRLMSQAAFERAGSGVSWDMELLFKALLPFASQVMDRAYLEQIMLTGMAYPRFFELSAFRNWFLKHQYPPEGITWFFENNLAAVLDWSAEMRARAERIYAFWGSFWPIAERIFKASPASVARMMSLDHWESVRGFLMGPDPEPLTRSFRLAAWSTLNQGAEAPVRPRPLPLAFFGDTPVTAGAGAAARVTP